MPRDSLGHLGCEGPCSHGPSAKKPIKIRLSPPQIAYLAGIVDGEGSIGVRRQFRKYGKRVYEYPILRVSNTDKNLMKWLQRTIGYAFRAKKPTPLSRKTMYDWQVENANVLLLLKLMLPYLIVKREKAASLLITARRMALSTYDSEPELTL